MSFAQIGERFAAIGGISAVTVATSGRTGATSDSTCVTIDRIGAKALRGRNCAPTDVRSDPIDATCLVTGMTFAGIDGTYVVTGAISVATVDTKKTGRGK